ncbi:MAG: YkgJ family cysteine cluster protein [Planctomycetota bacterium]|nr:YkgJ family cysteine cluster protein [Planctomycetota bacterium]
MLDKLIDDYLRLLARATGAFASFKDAAPEAVTCKPGCCECCVGLFEITPLDAEIVALASAQLPTAELARVRREAASQLEHLHAIESRVPVGRGVLGPAKKSPRVDFPVSFTERALSSLVSQVGNVRCPLLDDADRCALYPFRPLVCRLQGLPRVSRPCGVMSQEPGRPKGTKNLARLTREVDGIFGMEARMLSRYAKIVRARDAAHAVCFVATALA